MEANNSKKHVVTHLLLILGSIVMLFPFIWMILSSFKTVGEQMSVSASVSEYDTDDFGTCDLRGHIFQYGRIWICQDGISV